MISSQITFSFRRDISRSDNILHRYCHHFVFRNAKLGNSIFDSTRCKLSLTARLEYIDV